VGERAGRDAAFTEFARTGGPGLARTAFFLTGDRHLAEDLVQTALAQVYVHWDSIRDHEQVEAYARRVLVNANAAWWRRRSATELPVDVLPDLPARDDPAAYAEREPLVAALRTLPARQRAALVLRFFEDRSEADTAAILGCSTGSVKRHTSRGLDKLRVALDGEPLAGTAPRLRVAPAEGTR
jgi:RNA polymerase sigma-70 factor (sigma-E family)